MRSRTPALFLAVLAFALLTGCGGTTVLPSSAFPSPDDTSVSGTSQGLSDAPTSGGPTPVEPPPGTPGPSTPFRVAGSVRMEVNQGVDARKKFNDCQRAATQHAADTLDPSFDPTGLCIRKKGTSCSGIDQYGGAAVRITDPTGAVVGTGRLAPGTLDRALTLMGPKPTCVFGFAVTSVTGGFSSYGVEIGPARSTSTPAGADRVIVAVHDE